MPIQSKRTNLILGALLLLALLLTTELAAIATPADIIDRGPLFSPSPGPRPVSDPSIERVRFVMPDLDLLHRITVGEGLELNLFPDLVLRAVVDRIELDPAAALSWIGHIEGIEPSQVTFIEWKGQLAGNVALPDAFYQVRYAGDDIYTVRQLDQSAFPPELEPIPVGHPADSVPRAPGAPEADDGSTIDVLVVYTEAARLAAGGTAEIETEINLAVAQTNDSYSKSLVNQRLRLVHMEKVALDESDLDWEETLAYLANPVDGILDRAHTLRDAFCADNVVLIVADNQYCGVTNLMDTVSTAFESSAFSLVSFPCAADYYSFGHELGHNMSAHHDWFENDATIPYPENHGYVNLDARWRTIMAYNNECRSHGIDCNRLPYWSNPNISYGGDPMGVPPGTSTACREGDLDHPDCDAQNQLVLNNTAFTVANFRPSASCAEGPLLFHGYLADDDEGGGSNGNGDNVVDCGETVELYVDLYNYGDDSISGVSATISTTDPGVTWLDNTDSDYPAISSQTAGTNKDDFDLFIDPDLPNGHTIAFDLAITATGGGPWFDSFDLPVTCCSTPGAPILTAPENNALVRNPIPDFRWGETSNSSEYQIEIATDPGFSELFLNETTPFPSYTPNIALQNRTYYWRVAGRNTSDNCDLQGDYSDTRSITIQAKKTYLSLLMR